MNDGLTQPKAWAKFKSFAKKLIPSRSVRWVAIYVPAFTAALLFALQVVGGLDDMTAYVMESGTRSLPVLIGIAITYALATGLGWNLDNAERANYQRLVIAGKGNAIGAFCVLAGEMLAILALLALVLRAMLVWQG